MYCAECGKEIPEESEFCGYCGAVAAPAGGQAAAAASAATQGPPPGPPAPPPPDGPPPGGGAAPPMGTGVPPAQYGPASPRKSHLPWILGILGVLLVGGIVVVLLLGFAVGPKWFVGDDKASENPEETVEAFFKSWEKRDAEMLLGTMEPDFVKEIKAALGDDYIDLMNEYFFENFPEDLKIDIEKMEKEITGDKAKVTIIEGTMTYTDENGDKVTDEASEADLGVFELVKVDGEWYLSEDTLIDMGFDFSDLGDNDDTDFDDYGGDEGTESLVELPVDSEDEVLTVLFEEDEIWDWYMDTDLPQYELSEEDARWVAYLYGLDEDMNEIPFAWYEVDKETGDVFMITNE